MNSVRPSWNLRLAILAATAAIAVSVIYLPQSLLTGIAESLGVSPGAASVIATSVQAGYAVGIFFLVPLSDRIQPRRQVTLQLLLLTVALVISALLPGVVAVALGFLVVGLVANIAQLIIPAASKLSPPEQRGATTGALVGSILVGIFGGRIVASLLVEQLGWRWVVIVFAGLVLVTVPLLRFALRGDVELTGVGRSYGSLLIGTLRRIRVSPVLVQSSVMQFFAFATFNSLWTVMVLHLTGDPYGWSVLQAGLFGLIGLAAGLFTPFVGGFVDRFGAVRVSGVLLIALFFSTAAVIVVSDQIWLFGLAMFLVTWTNQSIQSANQTRVLVANADAAAAANTIFMVLVFLGGSFGALMGPLAYLAGGMPAVAGQALLFVAAACVVWLISRLRDRSRAAAAAIS